MWFFSPCIFWQEPLKLLHGSLGPCLSNFSATPMPGHTPHWCEFWSPTGRLGLLAWLQTCLITTDLSGNLNSRLKPVPVPGPALVMLLGCYGAVLVRPVPCLLCCCAQILAHLPLQNSPLLLSARSVVWFQQRHLDPLTLFIDSSDMTEADMVGSRSKLMQNTNMCLWRSIPLLNNLGGSNSIRYTKSFCQIQLFRMS